MKISTIYATILFHVSIVNSVDNFQLLLLHTNDMRGILQESLNEEGVRLGGYPRIAHVVKEARANATNKSFPPVLYLDAGDIYTEPLWKQPLTRKVLIELTNALRPDAANPGCQDLHGDAETFREFLQKIDFPLVASNMRFHQDRYAKVRPHLVLKIRQKKIGIVGYISSHSPWPFLGLANDTLVYFEDELEAVRRECAILKQRKQVDFIIGLGHAGLGVDKRIAQGIDDIDVIVGGYSYNLHWNGPKPPGEEAIKGPYPVIVTGTSGKKVLILHTYGFAKYIGRILLEFNEDNVVVNYAGNPVYLDQKIREDSSVLTMLNTFSEAVAKENPNEVLAQCIVPLDASLVREGESNLANVITDALVHYMSRRYQKHRLYSDGYWTDVPMALINAGAIRHSVQTNRTNMNITRRMVSELLPYRQHLVHLRMQGHYLVEALEDGVRSNGETSRGEFLQYSGLRVLFDTTREAGDRVLNVRIMCERCAQPTFGPVELTTSYNMLVSGFIAGGGDGHSTFRSHGVPVDVLEQFDVDVFKEYLQIVGKIRPESDERWQQLTSVEKRYTPPKQLRVGYL